MHSILRPGGPPWCTFVCMYVDLGLAVYSTFPSSQWGGHPLKLYRDLSLLPLTHFHFTGLIVKWHVSVFPAATFGLFSGISVSTVGRAYILEIHNLYLFFRKFFTWWGPVILRRHLISHSSCGAHSFPTQGHRGQAERKKSNFSLPREYFQTNSINLCGVLVIFQIPGAMGWGGQGE